jgi:mono/diheme cytochrome c family protein
MYKTMKKISLSAFLLPVTLFLGLLVANQPVSGQENANPSSSIPDNVNKIVTVSCVPCHTSQGGLLSKAKLNLSEWARYSPEKQKEKAAKMYSELNKGAMPPKMAREKRPEIIPTAEQAEIIKKWSESFPAEKK